MLLRRTPGTFVWRWLISRNGSPGFTAPNWTSVITGGWRGNRRQFDHADLHLAGSYRSTDSNGDWTHRSDEHSRGGHLFQALIWKLFRLSVLLAAFAGSALAQAPWPGQGGNAVGYTAAPNWPGSFTGTACGAASSGSNWATATLKTNCTYSTSSHTTISCSFCISNTWTSLVHPPWTTMFW